MAGLVLQYSYGGQSPASASLGKTRQDKTRQDKTRQDKTRTAGDRAFCITPITRSGRAAGSGVAKPQLAPTLGVTTLVLEKD